MNVLIVDDEPAVALLIGATLRSFASRIEEAHSFNEAKAWIKKLAFDLILLDIGLPDSPSFHTISRVKELRDGHSKVVILTGAWPPEASIKPEESGADDIIYKGDLKMMEKLKGLAAGAKLATA
jgi:DNA-binding response OmpR family regulator